MKNTLWDLYCTQEDMPDYVKNAYGLKKEVKKTLHYNVFVIKYYLNRIAVDLFGCVITKEKR